MTDKSPIVQRPGSPYPSVVLREQEEWGLTTADLVSPSRRLCKSGKSLATVEQGVDSKRLMRVASPTELLSGLPDGDNWQAQSKRSIARLWAYYLVCEDPQRRLDAREVSTLSHQVSLVRHILDHDHLRRVLIADEVGLGKTVEAGLLIKELLEGKPHLRILYLAPARLVTNVRREFDRLGLDFRQWTSSDPDARLTDPRIIASIHRAVHPRHRDAVLATEPWDVLIVDECHHLSDWAAGGGDPREKFKLVRDLIGCQPTAGRVILLSGTPHQGHVNRFENLLGLLNRGTESIEALNGRVIYRTKDDIVDWDGNLLFPRREVNEPLVVDLGPEYKQWIAHIHEFFQPSDDEATRNSFRRRAAGWRCAQALQWAASSPQAGLGYLVRQAIRAKWGLDDEPLRDCVLALRPYRAGPADESPGTLFERMKKEIGRQNSDGDVDDIEEDVDAEIEFAMTNDALEDLLREGLNIVRRSADEKWDLIKNEILDLAGDEKVVLFAQPIETVTALAAYLESASGERPALIIGGQTDNDRDAEVAKFCRPDGPRYLVSSRAGGEGINLQVARHLVHIDVPWNPMDMEQRVGRIHRFGSRRNVIVDTIVVKDSREADAYRIARTKLQRIAATLVEPERFETVFARVMCLMPPEELQDVLIHAPLSPFTSEDQEELARMVREGYTKWRDFDREFSEQQKRIHAQDPGLATWNDVAKFLMTYAKAQTATGFVSQRFVLHGDTVESVETAADVLELADQKCYACGDLGGMPVFGPRGETASQLGLNISSVREVMDRVAFPERNSGAAHIRWPEAVELPGLVIDHLFAVIVLVRQTVKTDQQAGWTETGASMRCYVFNSSTGEPVEAKQSEKQLLFKGLTQATIRAKPADISLMRQELLGVERSLVTQLRRPTDDELASGVRHAVFPLMTGIVEVGS